MAIIAFPAGLVVAQFAWGQTDYSLTEISDQSGASSTRTFGPPRWTCQIGSDANMAPVQAGVWEAFVTQLRGRVNHAAVYDVTRPQPQGTWLGATPTLLNTVAAGVSGLSIAADATQAFHTLLRGDMLQVGTGIGTSQLLKVVADATAFSGGQIDLTFEPPLRLGFTAGAAITLVKPLAYFKRSSGKSIWQGVPGALLLGGHSLDLLEQWS